MTPTAIIEQAAADGVTLVLSIAGTIKAAGEGAAVSRWVPVIREHKPAIVAALANSLPTISRPRRRANEREAAELVRLVEMLYAKDSKGERAEALALTLSDAEAALECYRLIAQARC